MIYEYNNIRGENDKILLLKVRRKSKHLSHSSSFGANMKKKQSDASLHVIEEYSNTF
jgi:hypothetical protein